LPQREYGGHNKELPIPKGAEIGIRGSFLFDLQLYLRVAVKKTRQTAMIDKSAFLPSEF
jgi:hypothetical protein